MKSITVFLALTTLQACSLGFYDVRNESDDSIKRERNISCDYRYSISLTVGGEPRETMWGPNGKYVSRNYEKIIKNYKTIAQEVFLDHSCNAEYIDKHARANLFINVDKTWLWDNGVGFITGLSLGIIPTWETIEQDRTFTITDMLNKKTNTTFLDMTLYNHLIFFPVFWVNFFTLDDDRIFKETLSNFIKNS